MVGSEPALAVTERSLTTADVTGLSSNSGQVTAVTLQSALTYAWNGLDAAPTEAVIDVRVAASGVSGPGPSFGDPLLTRTVTPPRVLEGSDTVSWGGPTGPIADGPFTSRFVTAPSGGRSDNTATSDPITAAARATLTTSDGSSSQDTTSATFTVEVTDEGVDYGGGDGGGVGGTAGTGGSA